MFVSLALALVKREKRVKLDFNISTIRREEISNYTYICRYINV